MSEIHSFKTVIEMWPSRKTMADDLGVSLQSVHHWHNRNRIPAEFYSRMLDAAYGRDIPLHSRQLLDLLDPDYCQHGNYSTKKQVVKTPASTRGRLK